MKFRIERQTITTVETKGGYRKQTITWNRVKVAFPVAFVFALPSDNDVKVLEYALENLRSEVADLTTRQELPEK